MNLESLRVFVTVAERGGFSAAARALRVSKSTVSLRIRELEEELATRLLQRTTRQVTLTEAGAVLLDRGRDILAAETEAERALGTLTAEATGTLRVSAPLSFGRRFATGVITRLLRDHPRLSVEYDLVDRTVDLVGERYDLAVRVGPPGGPNLIARRVGASRRVVVGAPSYLERQGVPRTPDDLRDHECLLYAHQHEADTWVFAGDGDGDNADRRVRVRGRLRCNNGDAIADAAANGVGLAWLPDLIAAPHIAAGRLRLVLDQRCRSVSPVNVVFPARSLRPLKVRLFVDYLSDAIAG